MSEVLRARWQWQEPVIVDEELVVNDDGSTVLWVAAAEAADRRAEAGTFATKLAEYVFVALRNAMSSAQRGSSRRPRPEVTGPEGSVVVDDELMALLHQVREVTAAVPVAVAALSWALGEPGAGDPITSWLLLDAVGKEVVRLEVASEVAIFGEAPDGIWSERWRVHPSRPVDIYDEEGNRMGSVGGGPMELAPGRGVTAALVEALRVDGPTNVFLRAAIRVGMVDPSGGAPPSPEWRNGELATPTQKTVVA